MKTYILIVSSLLLVLPIFVHANERDDFETMLTASKASDFATMESLLNAGFNLNKKDYLPNTEFSFLHLAVVHCDYEMVKWLLDRGADVNMLCEGWSPLGLADELKDTYPRGKIESEADRQSFVAERSEHQAKYEKIQAVLLDHGAMTIRTPASGLISELGGGNTFTDRPKYDSEHATFVYCKKDRIEVGHRDDVATFTLEQTNSLYHWLGGKLSSSEGVVVNLLPGSAHTYRLIKDSMLEFNLLYTELMTVDDYIRERGISAVIDNQTGSNHGLESTGAPPGAGTPETHP